MSSSSNRCWAKDISPCSGGMSGEHYWTRGMFLCETVDVGGIPGFQGERKRLHINQLKTKCLCRKHNSQLSDLDVAFIDFVNCLRETHRLQELRSQSRLRWHRTRRFVVDGAKIERCVFKMILNFAHVFRETFNGWIPPGLLAEVAFGKKEPSQGTGLSQLVHVGDKIHNEESAHFLFGKRDVDMHPNAVFFEIRNAWRFLCTWDIPIDDLPVLYVDNRIYNIDHSIYHPNTYNFNNSKYKDFRVSIDFDWTAKWNEKKNKRVVALRERYRAPSRD